MKPIRQNYEENSVLILNFPHTFRKRQVYLDKVLSALLS